MKKGGLFLLLWGVANVYGGTDIRSGSGQNNPDSMNAWFLGDDQSVYYCYVAAPDFGVSKFEIERALQSTFAIWSDYVDAKQVNRRREYLWKIATRFIMQQCNGKENLKFYLGVAPDGENEADFTQKHSLQATYANRTQYDVNTGWGKGYIWLAPQKSVKYNRDGVATLLDWSEPQALQLFLMHEVGHILGNGHTQGTIMTPDLLYDIGNRVNFQRTGDYSVDIKRELVVCTGCGRFSGRFMENGLYKNEIYTALTGQIFRNEPLTANLRFDGRGMEHWDAKTTATLTVGTSAGRKDFLLSFNMDQNQTVASLEYDAPVFYSLRMDGMGYVQKVKETSKSFVSYGTLITPSGDIFDTILERNFIGRQSVQPLTIRVFWRHVPCILFQAD